MEQDRDAFFTKLKQQLDDQTEFPSVYLFKFIIPNDNQKLALVEALFGPEAQVSIRNSRNDKYLSISAKELMLNAESVIQRYEKASTIEGIISL